MMKKLRMLNKEHRTSFTLKLKYEILPGEEKKNISDIAFLTNIYAKSPSFFIHHLNISSFTSGYVRDPKGFYSNSKELVLTSLAS
jgi:hypothetical protein